MIPYIGKNMLYENLWTFKNLLILNKLEKGIKSISGMQSTKYTNKQLLKSSYNSSISVNILAIFLLKNIISIISKIPIIVT